MSCTAIIVLNWNRPDLTLECLDSLRSLTLPEDHDTCIFLCDNASQDDSIARFRGWGRRHFPRAVPPEQARFLLFRTPANLGYAGGNNAAIRWALKLGFDYIWLLNNDTWVFPDALEHLLAAARCAQAGCFGATLLEKEAPEIVQCAGGYRLDPWTTRIRAAHAGRRYADVVSAPEPTLDYIAGAAMFVPAAVFRQVGLFNESFFLYYEEADFARRLRKAGYRLVWCRGARVLHAGGASIPATEFSHYHENLSTLRYLWQHHRSVFPVAAAFRLLAKGLYLPLDRRSHLLPSLLAAYRDFRPCRHREQASEAELCLSASVS